MADSTIMKALQDSFDATTRLTLAVKKLGQEIIASNQDASSTISQMIQTGVTYCSELVEPVNKIERLLMMPMSQIMREDALQLQFRAP